MVLLLIQILLFSLVYFLYQLFVDVDLQISHRKEIRKVKQVILQAA